MDFLQDNMPPRDRVHLSPDVLELNVNLSLNAYMDSPFRNQVPWDMFLNDVLPYASLNEPRENWRPLFVKKFSPLIKNATSLTEAIQALNKNIWKLWGIVFHSDQTPLIMSPFETLAYGYASCTGLSIFLVNACRSVGIPARVAGTPDWIQGGGNHDWVEVFDGESWSFTGANEYNAAGLNHTWFYPGKSSQQIPGSYNHSIYATSFARTGKNFVMAWDYQDITVPGIDVTDRYMAPKKSRELI